MSFQEVFFFSVLDLSDDKIQIFFLAGTLRLSSCAEISGLFSLLLASRSLLQSIVHGVSIETCFWRKNCYRSTNVLSPGPSENVFPCDPANINAGKTFICKF